MSTVSAAPIFCDGGLGAWQTVQPLPRSVAEHADVLLGDDIVIVGGNTNSGLDGHMPYATIKADGRTTGWTDAPTPFPEAQLSRSGAASLSGRIYVVGGKTNAAVATVSSAVRDANGSFQFTAETPLSVATERLTAVASSHYVFAVGGMGAFQYGLDVLSAPIDPQGHLGAWTSAGPMPALLTFAGVAIVNDQLIVVGGENSSAVATAPIHANGTLGGWLTTSSAPLPSWRNHFAFGAFGGHLYVAGGDASGATSEVLIGALDADGNVTSWSPGPSLPAPVVACAGLIH